MRSLLPRLLAAAAPGDAPPDAELLRRFVRDADAAALELVVRRHAPAVWAACRRILPEPDAEDAFQAAFLVLARKAAAVRGPSAGGWLHRVAVTAALKRKAAARPPLADVAAPPAPDALERGELAAAVHEELARLPDRYRLPVVLCDLEGETQPAAAARLGWPVGSVAGRLSRARALLRDRLTRRGFAPPVAALVVPAAVPSGRAVSAAVAAATGAAAPPVPVSLLATGVLSAMRTAKLKAFAVVLVSVGLAGAAGVGAYTAAAQPDPQPAAKAQPPAKALPADSPTRSAFPEIVAPKEFQNFDAFPLLDKGEVFRVTPADDTYRRLLKGRLDQDRLFISNELFRIPFAGNVMGGQGQFQPADLFNVLHAVEGSRVAAAELWRNDPRALDAWLVEVVRLTKMLEEYTSARVTADAAAPPRFPVVPNFQPQHVNLATAHRLAAEAALWKHRNPPKAP